MDEFRWLQQTKIAESTIAEMNLRPYCIFLEQDVFGEKIWSFYLTDFFFPQLYLF